MHSKSLRLRSIGSNGDDGTGNLLAEQEVIDLAANSDGGISTESGATFPLTSGGCTGIFQIVDLDRNEAANEIRVTWTSTPGKTYALEVAETPFEWIEVDDGIGANPDGEETTYMHASDFPAEVYYRVREL